MTTSTKIKPCPFCRAACHTYNNSQWWRVVCDACHCTGPRSATEVGAITLWNARCKENDEGMDETEARAALQADLDDAAKEDGNE